MNRSVLVLLLVAILSASSGILQAYADLDLGNERYIRDLDIFQNGPLIPAQRCVFYDVVYDYWYVFYGDTSGNDIYYVSTDDNGTTWGTPVVVGNANFEDYLQFFDLWYYYNGTHGRASYERSTDASSPSGTLWYRTGLTQADGTISWDGIEVNVHAADNPLGVSSGSNTAIDSDGYPWVGSNNYQGGLYSLVIRKGNNTYHSTWVDYPGFDGINGVILKGPGAGGSYTCLFVPFTTVPGMAVIYHQFTTGLYARISKDGSATFQAEDTITTMDLTGAGGFSANCDDNDDIHVVWVADANNSIMYAMYDYDLDTWTPARSILDLGAGYWGNAYTFTRSSFNSETDSFFVFWEYLPQSGVNPRYIQYMERYGNGTWGANATALTWDSDLWALSLGCFEVTETFTEDGRGSLVFMSNEGGGGTPSIWILPFTQEAPPAPPGPTLVEVQLYPGWVPFLVKMFAILGPFGFIAVMWRKVETFWDGVYLFVLIILCFIASMVVWTLGEALGEVITQYEYQ